MDTKITLIKQELIDIAKTSCSRTDMAIQLGISVPEICDLIKKYGISNRELIYMPTSQVRKLRNIDPTTSYSEIKLVDLVTNTNPDEVQEDLPEGKMQELS